MKHRFTLIIRKSQEGFFSIENVFRTIAKELSMPLVELPYPSNSFLNRFKNIVWLRRNVKGPIHITGHDHYLLCKKFKYPAILTVHDVEALKRKKGLKRKLFKLLWFDLPLSKSDHVTTISKTTLDELKAICHFKTPTSVIFNPLASDLKRKSKEFNPDKPRVLHIGTKKNKNLKNTLKAFSDVPCTLTIVGPDTTELDISLRDFKQEVVRKQNLSREELIAEYHQCDLLSFLSLEEGFGLPILEAQAIGRLVLTSNVSSMPEIAGEGAFFANPHEVNSIHETVQRLLNNPLERDKVIEAGFRNIKRFETKTIGENYAQIYAAHE